MRLFLMGFALFFAITLDDAGRIVQAQPYCAMYDNGTRDCGIPTLQSCDQSISGVGGYCAPDLTSQLRPNLIDRLRSQQSGQDPRPPSQDNSPDNPNWMPPPIGSQIQQRAIDMKLESAGFVMRRADTSQKMERLRSLPSHKFVARMKSGQRYYIYADPTDCRCAFVGYQTAYDTYRDMVSPPTPLPGYQRPDDRSPPSGSMMMPELIHDMNEDAGMFDVNDILHPGF